MNSLILEALAACEWQPATLLMFSENVYAPFLYYTYLGSALPAILIAVFVFVKQKNSLSSRLLLAMNLSFALWVFGSLITWATPHPSFVMFFWSMVNVVEPFVYFFAFYFAYVFLFKKDLTTVDKIVFSLPLLPTVILAPTPLMLIAFDLTNCDRNAYEGILAIYGYATEIFYVLMIVMFAIRAFVSRSVLKPEGRHPAFLFTIGITLFLGAFSLGNILELVTENWLIGQYGLLGAPLFSVLLAYLIIKYNAFNVKLFSIQAFMVVLWLLVLSLLFVRESDNANAIIILTLIIFAIIARPLSRSVEREIVGRVENERLATDLKHANERLQDLDRTKSEFVSIASHQLRTPLTAIRGFAELMRDGSYGPVPQRFHEPLSHVEESVQNMAMTINDFLNVSRIEGGTMQYDMTVFSLTELANRIASELEQYASKRGLALIFEKATNSPLMVCADEGKVRQILQNLIDNSIKYTPRGSITIKTELRSDSIALVSIIDTGIGMSEETQRIIFDKFVRATNANTVNIYGTGLGLYIAKEMAIAMHGRVSASSWGEGQGSTFMLELPLWDGTPPRDGAEVKKSPLSVLDPETGAG